MMIAVPTNGKKGLDEEVAEHFGRCNTYTILDENGKVIEIIDNTSEHMGGSGLPPELLKKNDVNVLLCRGLGPRAIRMCREFEIGVYVCEARIVKDLFELWEQKKIKKADLDDACEEHKQQD
jgi:predicted Fe-Mo cluster-binding NifX family protein